MELGHEPSGQRAQERSPARSPSRYNQHYNSALSGKVWDKDHFKDNQDLNGTVILNRSRSKPRSRSNERLHAECEEPAGKKSSFRKMIEANLPDDSVWQQHQSVDQGNASAFRGNLPQRAAAMPGQGAPPVPALKGLPLFD